MVTRFATYIIKAYIATTYVDDMLIDSKSLEKIHELKEKVKWKFDMKDLGEATRILGINILRDMRANSTFLP